MPCPPIPRNPGQFCSDLELEASPAAGSAIKEPARNDRRDNSNECCRVLSFIRHLLENMIRYYITRGKVRQSQVLFGRFLTQRLQDRQDSNLSFFAAETLRLCVKNFRDRSLCS